MSKKISDLNELVTPSGEEETVLASGGANYRIKLRNLKTLLGVDKAGLGLDHVDNTADIDKPVSNAVAQALSQKAPAQHTHAISSITGLQTTIEGIHQDVANANRDLADKTDVGHKHAIDDVTGLTTALASKVDQTAVTSQIQEAVTTAMTTPHPVHMADIVDYVAPSSTVNFVKMEW